LGTIKYEIIEALKPMSFEEMQAVIQGILSSQQQLQLSQQELQLSQQELQLSQQQFQSEMVDLKAVADRALQTADRAAQVADSNGRAIQAMLDQAVTDRLLHEERTRQHEERNRQHEERNRQHEERMRRLEAMSEGLINLSTAIDEDRPTILRLLNSNNNKLDSILDRLPPPQ
jgi:hypothetical protein